jgi:hypothetical protein
LSFFAVLDGNSDSGLNLAGPLSFIPLLTTGSRHVTQAQESIPGNGDEAPPTLTEESDPKKSLTIQFLYLNCLEALRAVTIMSTEKNPPNVIYSRLVVWGCGLFQPSNSIDLILEKDDVESTATFKRHVIGVLADIAILLGMKNEDNLNTNKRLI